MLVRESKTLNHLGVSIFVFKMKKKKRQRSTNRHMYMNCTKYCMLSYLHAYQLYRWTIPLVPWLLDNEIVQIKHLVNWNYNVTIIKK